MVGVPVGNYPRRLGRYQILGGLATGGMAEILLGRMAGMAGFSRHVVIKRIHPNHAADSNFVAMLLDEARIGSSLHHSNVVQVLELGEQAGDVFLVMEYLEGESVQRVASALRNTKERLSPRLVAYVVAEACAGLAAVHNLSVVHRDISPENLFITYDGAVKILDFGVAKATDRLTKTVTGHIKGKYAYMAPEQYDAQVDPRSDLFALGIVLHELCTGEPLFRQLNPLLIAHAIRETPIPTAIEINSEVPSRLSEICARALERDLENRWPTAHEMGESLRAFIENARGDPRVELRELMERMFHKEATTKRERIAALTARWSSVGTDLDSLPDELPFTTTDPVAVALPAFSADGPMPRPSLQSVAASTAPASTAWSATQATTINDNVIDATSIDATSIDATSINATSIDATLIDATFSDPRPVEAKPIATDSTGARSADTSPTDAERNTRQARYRRGAAIMAVGAVLALVIGVRWIWTAEDRDEQPSARAKHVVAPVTSPRVQTPTPAAGEAPNPVQTHSPDLPRKAPSRPPQIERVTISVSSKPPGAELLLRGERLGTTPAKVVLPRTQKPLVLMLRKDGYVDKPVSVTPDRAKGIAVELEFRRFGVPSSSP